MCSHIDIYILVVFIDNLFASFYKPSMVLIFLGNFVFHWYIVFYAKLFSKLFNVFVAMLLL